MERLEKTFNEAKGMINKQAESDVQVSSQQIESLLHTATQLQSQVLNHKLAGYE